MVETLGVLFQQHVKGGAQSPLHCARVIPLKASGVLACYLPDFVAFA